MLSLGFCVWCPSFGARVLILDGFGLFLCSRFPVLAESKFDSYSSPLFAENLSVSLLELWVVTPLLIVETLVADYVLRFEHGRWWLSVLLIPEYTRACPSMRPSKFYCPSWWPLLVVGRLTLFPSKSLWGDFCSISWLILTPACVTLYGDDVSATTIFTYNRYHTLKCLRNAVLDDHNAI